MCEIISIKPMFMQRFRGALSSYVSDGKYSRSISCIVSTVSALLKDVNALCLKSDDDNVD